VGVSLPDVDLTIYSITVNIVTGQVPNPVQRYIQWQTSNFTADKPVITSPQDLSTDYYYLKTFTAFCNMFNITLNEALLGCTPPEPPLTDKEGLSYNPTTRLFTLFLPSKFYAPPGYNPPVAKTAFLSFNAPLANLIANFDYIAQPNPIVAGQAFTLNTPRLTGDPTEPRTQIVQDFQSTDDVWSPIDTFVFTTTFLPLLPEQGSAPVVQGGSNLGQSLGTGSGFANIITDFVPDLAAGCQDGLSAQVYIPSGEYRISSMTTHQAIQQIDIALSWRYRLTGQLIPLFMNNLSSVSMKILLRRKDWGK
jgi:hypothetical protein